MNYKNPLTRPLGGKPNIKSLPPEPKTRTIKVKAGKPHTRTIKVHTPRSNGGTRAPKTGTVNVTDPFDQQVNAAVQLKYGPQEQALSQQITNARYNQMRAANWYQNYQKSLSQAAANVAANLAQYNPAASSGTPEAQQAQFANRALGQAFAGTQSQMTLDALQGAGLRNADFQSQFGNQIGQLQQQRGNLQSDKGAYATTIRGQLEAAAAKTANDQAKIQMAADALGIKSKTLNQVQIPLAKSLAQNRVQGQRVARTNARTQRKNASERANQDAINNAFKKNDLALKTYLAQHPELKGKGGTTVAQKYTDGIHRGAAILRLLHGTPPTKSNGQVTKPNPFYNLSPQQLAAHKQDFIDMLQTSSKAGHLTKDQATRAVNVFLKHMHAKGGDQNLGQIVSNVLKNLGK